MHGLAVIWNLALHLCYKEATPAVAVRVMFAFQSIFTQVVKVENARNGHCRPKEANCIDQTPISSSEAHEMNVPDTPCCIARYVLRTSHAVSPLLLAPLATYFMTRGLCCRHVKVQVPPGLVSNHDLSKAAMTDNFQLDRILVDPAKAIALIRSEAFLVTTSQFTWKYKGRAAKGQQGEGYDVHQLAKKCMGAYNVAHASVFVLLCDQAVQNAVQSCPVDLPAWDPECFKNVCKASWDALGLCCEGEHSLDLYSPFRANVMEYATMQPEESRLDIVRDFKHSAPVYEQYYGYRADKQVLFFGTPVSKGIRQINSNDDESANTFFPINIKYCQHACRTAGCHDFWKNEVSVRLARCTCRRTCSRTAV